MQKQQLLLKALRAVGASALLGLVSSTPWAGAGPFVPPVAPAAGALVDPNAEAPLPGSERGAAAAAPVATPVKATAAAAKDGPPDLAQIEKGRAMYRDFCQKCHGINMVSPGGGFFDLRTFPHDDKARFIDSVANGKRAMPAWGAILKPADIETVWAYVSSYRAAK